MSWDRYVEGMHFKWEFLFTNQDMQTFETLSGDHNPIHSDVNFAKSKGFESSRNIWMFTIKPDFTINWTRIT